MHVGVMILVKANEKVCKLTWWPDDGGSSENISPCTSLEGKLPFEQCLEHNLPYEGHHSPMIEVQHRPEQMYNNK
jgi:hypothetical protein